MNNTINAADAAQVLRDAMRNGATRFSFIKKDGSRRQACGTINMDIIPSSAKQFLDDNDGKWNAQDEDASIIKYFDIEKEGWRSCRTSSLLEIEGKEVK